MYLIYIVEYNLYLSFGIKCIHILILVSKDSISQEYFDYLAITYFKLNSYFDKWKLYRLCTVSFFFEIKYHWHNKTTNRSFKCYTLWRKDDCVAMHGMHSCIKHIKTSNQMSMWPYKSILPGKNEATLVCQHFFSEDVRCSLSNKIIISRL